MATQVEIAKVNNTKAVVSIPSWASALIDNDMQATNTPLKAYRVSPILYRAVQLRANALASIPFILSTMQGKEIDWLYDISLPQLLIEMESALLLTGAAYVLKNQPAMGGTRVVGLQWLNPTTMKVRLINGKIVFSQEVNGKVYGPFEKERMIYMREFSMSDDVGPGLSAGMVALNAANLRISMADFATGFFMGGAQPMTLLTIEGNPPPQELARAERFFKRTMTGVRNAFRVLAVRSDVKVTPVTPPLNSMAMPDLAEHTLREIAAAFGIPLTLLESNAANYATANSDTRNFYEQTITPRLLQYENALNEQLFEPQQLRLKFTPEAMAVYQQDEAERAGALTSLVSAGLTLKQAMVILGYKAIEDDAEKVQSFAQAPEPADNIVEVTHLLNPQNTTASGGTIAYGGGTTSMRSVSDIEAPSMLDTLMDTELKSWLRLCSKDYERSLKFECYYIPDEIEVAVKTFLALKPEQDALEHYFGHCFTKGAKLSTAAERRAAKAIAAAFDSYSAEITNAALQGNLNSKAIDQLVSSMVKDISPTLKSAYRRALTEAINSVGATVSKSSVGISADAYIGKQIEKVLAARITSTTKAQVMDAISRLQQDPNATVNLGKTFSQARVKMIAITETTRAKAMAVNEAQKRLSEAGINTVRVWTTRGDMKVCDICKSYANKKEEYPVRETWGSVIEDGPPAHPHCRCRLELAEA